MGNFLCCSRRVVLIRRKLVQQVFGWNRDKAEVASLGRVSTVNTADQGQFSCPRTSFSLSPPPPENQRPSPMPHRNAAYPHTGLGARRTAFRDRWGKYCSPTLHLYCWALGAATGASGVVRNSEAPRLDCAKYSWAGLYLCSVIQSRVWCLCPECWVFVLFINMCLNSLGIVDIKSV